MDRLLQDIRFALRSLRRAPGFIAIASLCIALGIAANVFVWSPVNALLLRPLPYDDSPRVMHLSMTREGRARQTYGSWSVPDYLDVAAWPTSPFSGIGAWSGRTWNIAGIGEPERLEGARVTASLFPMLGLRPALGRFFRPEEERGGRVIVIGHGVWTRKYGADPSIIGRPLNINGEPYTVIGVMARGVRFPETGNLWLPLSEEQTTRDARFLQVYARLAPGVTVAQADARLGDYMRGAATRFPDTNRGYGAWLQPAHEDIAGEVRPIFVIMLGAVGFVLLIACANVANLLLARGSVREREMAVRTALGASRGRIVRQLLTESLLLAILGGALGVLLGTWGVDVFTTRMMPTTVPYWMTFDVDRTVLLVTVGLTVVTGLTFGVVPALHLARASVHDTLKDAGGRGGTAAARSSRLRSGFVVTELALSLVLLIGAGLMVQSFLRAQSAKFGFDPRGLLTFNVAPTGARYASDSAYFEFVQSLERRLVALPGVSRVGGVSSLPVADCCSGTTYFPEGKEYPGAVAPSAVVTRVTPSFLDAFGMTLREGRGFSTFDRAGTPRVAIIGETFAAREWPGARAVGRRFRLTPNDSTWVTVVGVATDIVTHNVFDRPQAQVYFPLAQVTGVGRGISFVVRTSGDPSLLTGPVRAAVARLDPDLPIADLRTMEFVISDRMFQPRVYGSMFAIFAVAALLLASIGLYGLVSYAVVQRTHEMGIRMALGAERRDVIRLLMGSGIRLVALGLGIGLPAAFALARLLRGALYGVTATDPWTFVAIPLLLLTVALAASYLPARRASRVSPLVALRSD